MTLLINGCSFANIWKPTENFVSSMGCQRVVNLGKDGGSLQRVVRSTVEWIAQNEKPSFVIIPIPLASRWELSIAQDEDVIDGTWYPLQISEYLKKEKISNLVDFNKLKKMSNLYYGSIPDVRTYWDKAFTEIILLSSFLSQNKIDYLMFDMCNNFDLRHLTGYQGFEKIKLIEKNKKIIDLFTFCGNRFMWETLPSDEKEKIDSLMHHHRLVEYKKLEKYLLNYR